MKPSTTAILVAGFLAVSALAAEPRDNAQPDYPDPQRVYTEAEAVQIGWPSLAGPYGNFQPLRTQTPIVDDLAKATIAWVSENSDLGIAKQGTPFGKSFQSGSQIAKYLGPEAAHHPGSWAGAIVAEGKVFASSFRPAGPFFECDFPDHKPAKVRVDAEDFVVAMDFKTGKTVWLSAEPGGMLIGGGKRQGFQVAPVYSRGRIFSMGSTGRLFAYDAATGKKVWQSDIGGAYQAQEQVRARILSGLAKRKWSYAQSPAWHTSLTVADNTLIVPTFVKGGLRGIDPQSGKVKWEAAGVGSHLVTPSIYRSGGREYVLTANPDGQMRLLDPRDGKELWKMDGLGGAYFTLSPSDKYVLLNVNGKSGKTKGEGRVPGFYGAYRITPAAATPAWKMPEEPRNGFEVWMDSEARYRYTIRGALAYLDTQGLPHQVPGRFLIVKEDTGEIVAEHINAGGEADTIGGLWYLIGDKMLCRSNNMHGPTHGGRHPWVLWSIAGNQIARLPGALDKNEFTNGYEVNMEYPVVAGRIFERTAAGAVLCYDLRAETK
ncbi:MAG: PQQ-binding-like beta-propeller repeat protein [Thermoguttaceae bacterium]